MHASATRQRKSGSLPCKFDTRSGPTAELQQHLSRRFHAVEGASSLKVPEGLASAPQHSLSRHTLTFTRTASPQGSHRSIATSAPPGAGSGGSMRSARSTAALGAPPPQSGPGALPVQHGGPSRGSSARYCVSVQQSPVGGSSAPTLPTPCKNGSLKVKMATRLFGDGVHLSTPENQSKVTDEPRRKAPPPKAINFDSHPSGSPPPGCVRQEPPAPLPKSARSLEGPLRRIAAPVRQEAWQEMHRKVDVSRDCTPLTTPRSDPATEQMRREMDILRWENTALKNKANAEASAMEDILKTNADLLLKVSAQDEMLKRQTETLKEHQATLYENQELRRSKDTGHARLDEAIEALGLKDEQLKKVQAALEEQSQQHHDDMEDKLRLFEDKCREEKQRLVVQLKGMKADNDTLFMAKAEQEKQIQTIPACSESRLRAAIAHQGTTTEQLQEAIASVEAFLGEAKRELSSRQLRDQRAAYERLHAAETQGEEQQLVEAIAEARRTCIDEEDISRAEQRLQDIRSLTDEQKAAKAAKELETQRKARAFLLIKKDDGAQLVKLLELADNEATGSKWQDWRDHSGRTLLQFARELRAASCQRSLSELVNLTAPDGPALLRPLQAQLPSLAQTAQKVSKQQPLDVKLLALDVQTPGPSDVPSKPLSPSVLDMPLPAASGTMESLGELALPSSAVVASIDETSERIPVDEEMALKTQALRAVVGDDTPALVQVIERLPVEIWSKWQNKAGRDLLTLSQERGSFAAYSYLARQLGLLKDAKREAFEDRENVWVMVKGEVQPRRATVIGDFTEEAENILVEFWDGYDPASEVERCFVLKAHS